MGVIKSVLGIADIVSVFACDAEHCMLVDTPTVCLHTWLRPRYNYVSILFYEALLMAHDGMIRRRINHVTTHSSVSQAHPHGGDDE